MTYYDNAADRAAANLEFVTLPCMVCGAIYGAPKYVMETPHVRFIEDGHIYVECGECGEITDEGPDPDYDPNEYDEFSGPHHMEPPC